MSYWQRKSRLRYPLLEALASHFNRSINSNMACSSWPNGADLSQMKNLASRMTDEWVPALTALAPGSGCYMNEVGSPFYSCLSLGLFGHSFSRMRHHESNREFSRPILKPPIGNNRCIATTMTPYMLSRRSTILAICSMHLRRLEATIGNKWPVEPCVR